MQGSMSIKFKRLIPFFSLWPYGLCKTWIHSNACQTDSINIFDVMASIVFDIEGCSNNFPISRFLRYQNISSGAQSHGNLGVCSNDL